MLLFSAAHVSTTVQSVLRTQSVLFTRLAGTLSQDREFQQEVSLNSKTMLWNVLLKVPGCFQDRSSMQHFT